MFWGKLVWFKLYTHRPFVSHNRRSNYIIITCNSVFSAFGFSLSLYLSLSSFFSFSLPQFGVADYVYDYLLSDHFVVQLKSMVAKIKSNEYDFTSQSFVEAVEKVVKGAQPVVSANASEQNIHGKMIDELFGRLNAYDAINVKETIETMNVTMEKMKETISQQADMIEDLHRKLQGPNPQRVTDGKETKDTTDVDYGSEDEVDSGEKKRFYGDHAWFGKGSKSSSYDDVPMGSGEYAVQRVGPIYPGFGGHGSSSYPMSKSSSYPESKGSSTVTVFSRYQVSDDWKGGWKGGKW